MALFIPVAARVGIGVAVTLIPTAWWAVKKLIKEKTCTICDESLNSGCLYLLKCNHAFHMKCFKLYAHSFGECTIECRTCQEKIKMTFEERNELVTNLSEGLIYCQSCKKIMKETKSRILCGHYFCATCLQSYLIALSLCRSQSKCPMKECGSPIQNDVDLPTNYEFDSSSNEIPVEVQVQDVPPKIGLSKKFLLLFKKNGDK